MSRGYRYRPVDAFPAFRPLVVIYLTDEKLGVTPTVIALKPDEIECSIFGDKCISSGCVLDPGA
jgi:hypothetical protein